MKRVLPAAGAAVGGGVCAFLLMAHDGHAPFGVPLGAVCVGAATWGILGLVRARVAGDEPPKTTTRAQTLAAPLALVGAALVCFLGSLALASRGAVGEPFSGIAVTGAFVALVAAVFFAGRRLGPWATDESGRPRPLHARHGFWLFVVAAVLYLPALGAGSLWDPWETHYGEVAREILSRDDWLSLWWSRDGWFFSKPVLEMWMEALALATLGVGYGPDHVLAAAHGVIARPEWALRAPNVLVAMVGCYLLYKGVARVLGRRAGLLGGIVLLTSPQWFFMGRQAITDMPYVGAMCGAMGLALLGLAARDDELAGDYEIRAGTYVLRISAWHLVLGAIVLVALPQVLYLASRNVELVLHGPGAHGFRPHLDEFSSGSPGNCALPGNASCTSQRPSGHFEPWMQALLWCVAALSVLWTARKERRKKRILYLGAWTLLAIGVMAKGPAALGLPVLAIGGYLVVARRWGEILKLEIVRGTVVVAALALPWFVALVIRHGNPFTDELIFHDMVSRAFDHVHDTNAGEDTSLRYYVWQLGYALFPWTALVPLAIARTLRRPDAAPRTEAHVILFLWALFAFALFSLMGTKFHHYIFPAVPPLAMLIGAALDALLARLVVGRSAGSARAHASLMDGAAIVAGVLIAVLVARDLVAATGTGAPVGAARMLQLFTYRYDRGWPETLDLRLAIALLAGLAIVCIAALAIRRARRVAVWGAAAVAALWCAWGLDVYEPRVSPHWGQRDVLATYYRMRGGVDEPLIAYQLNWKGENFYTGNHVAVFVSSGSPFTSWVGEQKAHGIRVVYVVTEQGRVAALEAELHATSAQAVTDRRTSNQFVLVRAEL